MPTHSSAGAGPAALRARADARAARAARVAGSVALLGIAADHLYVYRADHYDAIPTIGTLFVLDAAGAFVLGLLLAAPLTRWLGTRRGPRLLGLAAAAGIGLAASTLGGLLISEHTPVFGFMEVGYRPVVVLSIVAEAGALIALPAFLWLQATTSQRSRHATMPSSSNVTSLPSTKGAPMKRPFLLLPAVVIAAAGVAGLTGVFASSRGASAVAAPTASIMPMPADATVATAVTGPVRLELHQRVVKVKIMNFAFLPKRVEVSPGTRVVWTNEDSDPHTVTTDKTGFSSQALNTGQSYTHVMTKAGTFTYHCTIHPFMHGAVTVAG